jgi:hypothetical protein
MKTTLLILLGVGLGWFIRSAVADADEGKDWRDAAYWAVFAAVDIVCVLVSSAFLKL